MNVEWVALESVLTFHDLQISENGGVEGIRDQGSLESALGRPEHLAQYAEPDLFDLAAAYAWGIVRNHPFVDGNKRTAFVVAVAFLELNGHELKVDEADAAIVFLRLAANEYSEHDLAEWLRRNSE
ncbi:MAG: type II toxin-antitoxin system death-on-curing family toxin [Propylenella sp.]